MPILKNAKKALRASKHKAEHNQRVRSRVKSSSDAVKKSPTASALAAAYRAIDTAVKRNVFHKNKAARLKSQLAKLVKPAKLEKPAPKKSAKKASPAKKKAAPKKKTAKK
jgi:ribosomal protein S20